MNPNTNDHDLDAELAALQRELRRTVLHCAIGAAIIITLFALGFALGR